MLHVDIVDSHFDTFYFAWRCRNMLSELCKEKKGATDFFLHWTAFFKIQHTYTHASTACNPPPPKKSTWSLLLRIIFFSWISYWCDFVKKCFFSHWIHTAVRRYFCWSIFWIMHYFSFLHLDQLEFPPRSPESRILTSLGFTLKRI